MLRAWPVAEEEAAGYEVSLATFAFQPLVALLLMLPAACSLLQGAGEASQPWGAAQHAGLVASWGRRRPA